MLRDNIQLVTVFALRYSSLQCRLISMVLIGIRQSPIFGFFESTPEVRVLCSASITRHQRSYDPVRLPPGPPPENDVEVATLIPNGYPPITCITFPTCCAHYPGGSNGCTCRWLPHSRGLPQMTGGSASALALSRPARASHALRPVGSLSRPRRPLSRGFSPDGYPTKPLASYQIYRLLSGWNLPPLVIHAFGAHGHLQTFCYRGRGMM
jgi:hypothetical protein